MKEYRIIPISPAAKALSKCEDGSELYHNYLVDSEQEAKEWAESELGLTTDDYKIIEIDIITSLMCARTEDQIDEEIYKFRDIVWYNRCYCQVISEYEERGEPLPENIREAGRMVEEAYPAKLLKPISDYEWGMIHGKLSALRWVTGDYWDDLAT